MLTICESEAVLTPRFSHFSRPHLTSFRGNAHAALISCTQSCPGGEATQQQQEAAVNVGPVLIVIDGLDQCPDPRMREKVLYVLSKKLVSLPPNIHWLVTARLEADIARTFLLARAQAERRRSQSRPAPEPERTSGLARQGCGAHDRGSARAAVSTRARRRVAHEVTVAAHARPARGRVHGANTKGGTLHAPLSVACTVTEVRSQGVPCPSHHLRSRTPPFLGTL
jgi:hypothetical protein